MTPTVVTNADQEPLTGAFGIRQLVDRRAAGADAQVAPPVAAPDDDAPQWTPGSANRPSFSAEEATDAHGAPWSRPAPESSTPAIDWQDPASWSASLVGAVAPAAGSRAAEYERPTRGQDSQTGQDQRWTPPPPPPPPQPRAYAAPVANSKADAAFALGIISIFANLFYVPGILAIVWGGRERRENSKANAGYICGIIGTVLSVLGTLLFVIVLASAGSAVNDAVNSLPDSSGPGTLNPSTAASLSKNLYNVGDTAKTGDFEVTVFGFTDPQPSGNEFLEPSPGMRFVSVDVQITNPDSKDQQLFSSLLGFHLLDDQNFQYGEDLMDAGLTPGAPDGEIAAGQSIRGFVAFEVPEDASGLKLRVQGSLTAAGAVFNLT
jgi:hypothetical protein